MVTTECAARHVFDAPADCENKHSHSFSVSHRTVPAAADDQDLNQLITSSIITVYFWHLQYDLKSEGLKYSVFIHFTVNILILMFNLFWKSNKHVFNSHWTLKNDIKTIKLYFSFISVYKLNKLDCFWYLSSNVFVNKVLLKRNQSVFMKMVWRLKDVTGWQSVIDRGADQ